MLALTHHAIVQIAARRTGIRSWFTEYAVLGDDIVIASAPVAEAYRILMEDLGVDINLSKSLVSSIGACEFAKKLIIEGVDFSPLGPKSILEMIQSPAHLKSHVLSNQTMIEERMEGGVLDRAVLKDHLRDLILGSLPLSSIKWRNKIRACY